MRLRYLQLSHYPPLADFAVDFSARAPWAAFEPQLDPLHCAVHFVIGPNGSGKSHLLRALASTFLAIADQRRPVFPVSLVYELGRPGTPGHRTFIFDSDGEASGTILWQADGWAFDKSTDLDSFRNTIEALRIQPPLPPGHKAAVFNPRIRRGDYPQAARDALPRAVLVYSSGLLDLWRAAWVAPVSAGALDIVTQSEDYDTTLERPVDWTAEDEERITQVETPAGKPLSAPAASPTSGAEDLFRRPLLLEPLQLTAALLVMALEEAKERRAGNRNTALAKLFEKVEWQHFVGVRLKLNLKRLNQVPGPLLTRLHDALLVAGEVLAEPEPSTVRIVYFDVDGALLPREEPALLLAHELKTFGTQDQALRALLGDPDATVFERFGALLNWRQHGVLEDIELFIRRADKPETESITSLADAGVLRYSELSDGERMVLGRWALLHLLAGHEDALLILDEPETHFNDAWKREIVQVVDEAMGRDASQVLIATHSAIVLSDVFDDEVVRLEKLGGRSELTPKGESTFATDPSALMMSVFGAEDSIGQRAQQRIETFMRAAANNPAPSANDVQRLRELIRRLGKGFYRTELQTLLNRWQQLPDVGTIQGVIPTLQSDTLKNELLALIVKAQQAANPRESGDA